jgi:flagellar protein FliO/FliZ
MDGIDLNLTDYIKFVFAFVFVLALIALATTAARRFGFGLPTNPRNATQRRLGIVESLNVDGKRRMVLIRRDDTEHLLLLGATTELVIESSIKPPENTFPKPLKDTSRETEHGDETGRDRHKLHQNPPLPETLEPPSKNADTDARTEEKS